MDFDKPITWGTFTRFALVGAAEYAMLALIEDAPTAVRVATILCALAALGVLEGARWLRGIHRYLFDISIILILMIYLGFIGYAIHHASERKRIMAGLQDIYISSGKLVNREIFGITSLSNNFDKADVERYKVDFNRWENASRQWIKQNISEAAEERFLDRSNVSYFNYGNRVSDAPEYSEVRNRLQEERRNLSTIMESKIYVD